jgi:NTP pyrophosphatase (non-canonical NTP hydrolase)
VPSNQERRDWVFFDVNEERKIQDKRWGPVPRLFDYGSALAILVEEVGEVAQAIVNNDPADLLRAELIQVAAVAVWWVEELDAQSDARGGTSLRG